MKFKIIKYKKTLIFNSEVRGLRIGKREFIAGEDGGPIYDQIKGIFADRIELQMSTNTSTLIPAFKILGLPYSDYFNGRDVVKSQNDITFYWNKSKLAAFYNRFSTDDTPYGKREKIIKSAVDFIIDSIDGLPLKNEYLKKIAEPVKLLGFYQGFPVFDDSTGFAKLICRLGIHVGSEYVTISTPLDKYKNDVYELADSVSAILGQEASKKKNRVIFKKTVKLLKLLKVL